MGYLVGPKSRAEVEALCAEAGNSDGTFCIRELNAGLALCVIFKGKPSHFAVAQTGDHWTINKINYGDCTSLEGVRAIAPERTGLLCLRRILDLLSRPPEEPAK